MAFAEKKKRVSPTKQKQRRHAAEVKSWNPSDKPNWITEAVYRDKIQPRLSDITISTVAYTLGISEPYAAEIRAGRYLPHPRHWQLLTHTGVGPRRKNW